jgi:hypothetical protein
MLEWTMSFMIPAGVPRYEKKSGLPILQGFDVLKKIKQYDIIV